MKRSEMIKLIIPILGGWSDKESEAKAIIEKLEAAGMLPPKLPIGQSVSFEDNNKWEDE